MQCPTCGHQNRADARFCDGCGAPLLQRNQAATVPPGSQFNAQNAGPGGVGWQSARSMDQSLPVSPPQQPVALKPLSAAAAAPPPIQPGGHGKIKGTARNVQLRQAVSVRTGLQESILTFRLEHYDGSGNPTKPVPVEMRGLTITGFISDGDQVEASGKVKKDGLVRAKQARNLTTGAMVRTKGISTGVKVVWGIALAVIVAFIVIQIVFHGILGQHPGGFSSPNISTADEVLSGFCASLRAGNPQGAYDGYSPGLKSEVSSEQFSHMWSGKYMGGCTRDAVQETGNQMTSTLYITASSMPGPQSSQQTYTYHVVLVQDGSNCWKNDCLQQQ